MVPTDSIYEYDDIKKTLKDELKSSRYKHVIGVAYTSANLAMRYGIDMNKAYLSGLLHDCAKAYPVDSFIAMANKYNIPVSKAEEANNQLLHAKLGSYFAKERFGITDEDILNAIRFHTTGRANMSLLEKIVFTADYIEPGRNEAPNLKLIRELSYENIDKAITKILEDTFIHLKEKNYAIDEIAYEAYTFYKGE